MRVQRSSSLTRLPPKTGDRLTSAGRPRSESCLAIETAPGRTPVRRHNKERSTRWRAPGGDRNLISIRNAGPNPVRSTGSLALELSREADVDLALFDLQGRRLETLRSGRQSAGRTMVGLSAAGLRSGLYFVKLSVDGVEKDRLKVTVLH